MGSAKKFVVLLLTIMGVFGVSMGATYTVGDSAGWTNDGKVNYTKWAESKSFQIGDTIVFEFNKDFHNVARVNHTNYKNCNATGATHVDKSGNFSFTIKRDSHFYFICTVPGHCQAGQKVDIRAAKSSAPKSAPTTPPPASSPPKSTPSTPPPASSPPSPATTPPPSPSPVPWSPNSPSPAPSPKASGSSSIKGFLSGFSLLVIAVSVFGFAY